MKRDWPRIKQTKNHGSTVFCVDSRISGKGERRFFSTRAEAKVFAEGERTKRINQGTAAVHNAELASFGWNVHDAIQHALKFLRSQQKTTPLADAITAFLEAKKAQGVSSRYINDLRLRLRRFADAHPEAAVEGISTSTVSVFLRGMKAHSTTRMNFRRDLHTFFEWCADEEMILDKDKINPVTRAATFKGDDGDVATISPEQFEALLANADPIILPALVLGGFCAIRQAEITRLDWSKINLAQKTITIDKTVAKTNARRVVRIPEPAIAWLRPLAKKSGPVLPPQPSRQAGRGRKWNPTPAARLYQQAREAWDMARLLAGFGPLGTALAKIRDYQAKMPKKDREALVPWPANGLRHSAISARLALSNDPEAAARAFGVEGSSEAAALVSPEKVAEDSGNSRTTIKKHYDALFLPDEASRWYSILPPEDQKVIALPSKVA